MNKKQILGISLLAAVPAALLLMVLVMAAVNHGGGVFGGLKWLFWGIGLAAAGMTAVGPVLILLFYPAAGFAAAAASGGGGSAGLREGTAESAQGDLSQSMGDSGEQGFDDDLNAGGDDFENFESGFDEEK